MPRSPYMLSSEIRRIAREWEKYKCTTIRPVKGLVRLLDGYAKKFSNRPNATLLVLGGTPELRSLGAQYRYRVTAVDRSARMLKAMRLLCRPKPKNEQMRVADWTNIPLQPRSFDLIFGDDSINMLPWKKWSALLKECARLLKNDGQFVMQVMVESSADKLVDLETVAKRWRTGEIKSLGDLTKYLNYTTHDRKSYRSSFQKYLKKLERLRNHPLYAPLWNAQKRYAHFNSQPTHPPIGKFERLAKRYFRIVQRRYIKDFEYCKYEPVYVLERLRNRGTLNVRRTTQNALRKTQNTKR